MKYWKARLALALQSAILSNRCYEHPGVWVLSADADKRVVAAEGVEISSMAVRGRIHHGDLLRLDLPDEYNLLFGLDVFEHLAGDARSIATTCGIGRQSADRSMCFRRMVRRAAATP